MPFHAMAALRVKRPDSLPWLLFFATAALAAVWSLSLQHQRKRFFPREPNEFHTADRLVEDLQKTQDVLQKNPEDLSALLDLAIIRFQKGPDHYLEALETLERAREFGLLDDRLFYYAGVMYEAKGLPDFARPDYERFVRNNPDDAEARMRLGNLYYRLEELDKAGRSYEILLEARPEDPLAAFNLAVVRRDQKRWEDGLALLEPLLQRKDWPLPEGGLKVLGDLYRGRGDIAKALDAYQQQLFRRKDDLQAWEDLAVTFEQIGDLAEARNHWEQALSRDPKNRKAKESLQRLKRKIAAAERDAKKKR